MVENGITFVKSILQTCNTNSSTYIYSCSAENYADNDTVYTESTTIPEGTEFVLEICKDSCKY